MISDALMSLASARAGDKPFTINGASYQPAEDPDGTGALFEAIANDPVATQRFWGIFAQTQIPAEFFAEENVNKIMSGES